MGTIVGGQWTYSGDPSTDDKDAVRFLIEDTDITDQLVSDEEILWALGQFGSALRTAAMLCHRIATAGGMVDKQVGDLRISGSQRATRYADLAQQYRRQSDIGATPSAGGISKDARDAEIADTDRVAPSFTVGQFDDPTNAQSSRTAAST